MLFQSSPEKSILQLVVLNKNYTFYTFEKKIIFFFAYLYFYKVNGKKRQN